MPFSSLLIHVCNIQAKTLNTTGYEQTASWTTTGTNIPCRYNANSGANINDADQVRINKDDDTFFFDPNVNITRGNRIVYDGKNYDVIKVNKISDSQAVHHLEVEARHIDSK
jgi:hypothetical protein